MYALGARSYTFSSLCGMCWVFGATAGPSTLQSYRVGSTLIVQRHGGKRKANGLDKQVLGLELLDYDPGTRGRALRKCYAFLSLIFLCRTTRDLPERYASFSRWNNSTGG